MKYNVDNRCRDEPSADCRFLLSHMYRIYTNFYRQHIIRAEKLNTSAETYLNEESNVVRVCMRRWVCAFSTYAECVRYMNMCELKKRSKAQKRINQNNTEFTHWHKTVFLECKQYWRFSVFRRVFLFMCSACTV